MLAVALVELQGPDGQVVYVNPAEVTTVREPRGLNTGHWGAAIKCLVMLADGKFITVINPCDDVRKKLER